MGMEHHINNKNKEMMMGEILQILLHGELVSMGNEGGREIGNGLGL